MGFVKKKRGQILQLYKMAFLGVFENLRQLYGIFEGLGEKHLKPL